MELKRYQWDVLNDIEAYLVSLDKTSGINAAWREYWLNKGYATGGARSSATENARTRGSASLPCGTAENAQERVPPVRNPPLFQRDCWDRQLRTGEIYTQKWEYVRNNPVRKGLVANADDWPYQGRMNIIEWHERI